MCGCLKEECRCSHFCFKYSSPHHFLISQWPIPQSKYIWWRTFWAVWHTVWVLYSIKLEIDIVQSKMGALKWFIYLTHQSYLILTIQSIIYFYVVWRARKTGRKQSVHATMGCILKTLWLLTTVSFDLAIIVSLLYWTLVFTELKYVVTIMTHVINSVYVLSDIFVSAAPVRLLHFIHSMIYGMIYLIFTVVYHHLKGTNSQSKPYIYKALNWSQPESAAIVSLGSLLIAIPLVHMMQFMLYNLRLWIFQTTTCCSCCDDNDGDDDADKRERQEEEIVPV